MVTADLFLIILGLIYLIYASVSDIKKREVPNWLSFSLIGFALAYRAFFSILNSDLMFFVYGVIGLIIFVGLGYGFYYARIFAGGDAKLLFGLGIVFSFSSSLTGNLIIFLLFAVLLLFFGGLWGIVFSLFIVYGNKRKFSQEFSHQVKINKKLVYYSLIIGIFSLILLFLDSIFVFISILIFIFPFLYTYAKSVEESCMIVFVSTNELIEGDWLYSQVKVGKRIIKPYWEGLSSEELAILRKKKEKVRVKQGIPFVPAFLFAFLALIYLLYFKPDIFSLFF